jgi:hypothetical protein
MTTKSKAGPPTTRPRRRICPDPNIPNIKREIGRYVNVYGPSGSSSSTYGQSATCGHSMDKGRVYVHKRRFGDGLFEQEDGYDQRQFMYNHRFDDFRNYSRGKIPQHPWP